MIAVLCTVAVLSGGVGFRGGGQLSRGGPGAGRRSYGQVSNWPVAFFVGGSSIYQASQERRRKVHDGGSAYNPTARLRVLLT